MQENSIKSVHTPASEVFSGALVVALYGCVAAFIIINVVHLLSLTAGDAIVWPAKIGIALLVATCVVAVDLHIAHEISLTKGQQTASEIGLAPPPQAAKGAKARLLSRAALGGSQAVLFVPVTLTMMLEPDIRDHQDKKQLVIYAAEIQDARKEVDGRLVREDQKVAEIDAQITATINAAPALPSPNKAAALLATDLANAQALLVAAETNLIRLRSDMAAADQRLTSLEADPSVGVDRLIAARSDARARKSAYNAVFNESRNYQNRVNALQRSILAGEKDAAKADLEAKATSSKNLKDLREARDRQLLIRNETADGKDLLVAQLLAKNPRVIPPSRGPAASTTALWQMMWENFGALILGIALAVFVTLADLSAILAQVFSTGRATHLRRYLLSQQAVMELEDRAQSLFAAAAQRRARRAQELAEHELERKFWTEFMNTPGGLGSGPH